jgi:cytochrome c-type biogenesis protein CcmE
MTNRRRRAYVAIGMCVVAIGAIVALTVVLSGNIQYFRTVSEAVAHRSDRSQFRIAGAVVNGSVVPTHAGVDFKITDGKATAEIVHHGDPPQLFKPGAPVVCEGHWGAGGAFSSDRILIKHGSDYQPPKVRQPSAARAR